MNELDEALLNATFHGLLERVRTLLDNGANVNAHDQNGDRPLHYAAGCGHLEICKVLIQYGAHISIREKYGETPLHAAARAGKADVCYFLIAAGADPQALDGYGNPVWAVADDQDTANVIAQAISTLSTGGSNRFNS